MAIGLVCVLFFVILFVVLAIGIVLVVIFATRSSALRRNPKTTTATAMAPRRSPMTTVTESASIARPDRYQE